MTDSPIRCGIVGTGAFAQTHAEAIAANAKTVLAAAFDIDSRCAAAFTEQYGGNMYESIDALLNVDVVDVIALCTPDTTHASLIREILGHSHAPPLLIVEKPLCMSREEMQSLSTLSEDLQRRIVIDHTRRFNPGFQQLHERIASGEFGELQSLHWRYYAGWMHIAVHAVDLLRMLFGEFACTGSRVQGTDRFANDPLLAVELTSQKFPEAAISFEGVPEHPYRLFEGECFTSKGRIRISWNNVSIDTMSEQYVGTPQLVQTEHFTVNSPLECVEFLYTDAAAFLRNGDERILQAAGLAQATGTMDILFTAQEFASL